MNLKLDSYRMDIERVNRKFDPGNPVSRSTYFEAVGIGILEGLIHGKKTIALQKLTLRSTWREPRAPKYYALSMEFILFFTSNNNNNILYCCYYYYF